MSEKTARNNVGRDDFVKAFVLAHKNGQTEKDVATSLGLKLPSVSQRAAAYRKKNINLPKLARSNGSRLGLESDVKRLNDLINNS